MAYSFAKENAGLPSKRYVQYFEMFGNRAIYKDGWIACCRHGRLPWVNVGSADFRNDKWELYNIAEDFSEANDLAAKFPEKLLELKAVFFVEAAKYDVLPLDDRFIERGDVSNRPSYFYGRKTVTFYPGMIRLPEGSAPQTTNITHTITVKAEIPSGGAKGVIVCLGGDTGGWSLCVMDQKLIYHYNWFDTARYEAISKKNIPTGKVELKVEFINETKVLFGPATVKLYINGENVGEAKIERQAGRFSLESLDVGMDTLSPVSKAYKDQMPFAFTGKIDSVRFDFGGGVEQTPQQEHDLKKAMD
jgi:arylsulfatase